MSLPIPDADAKIISSKLQQLIVQTIHARGGWISFSEYMRLALYAPGLGYYSAGSAKLGPGGDFTTAPEISPLFGQTLANTVAPVLKQGAGNNILEFGAGSGRLAVTIIEALEQQQALPGTYYILEVSPDLRQRQREYIRTHLPRLADRFQWLEYLPAEFTGVMLGNEVLDAMPCHLISQHDDILLERGVSLDTKQALIFQDQPITSQALQEATRHLSLATPYVTEVQLEAQGFIKSLAQILQKGVILLIDYGFEDSEYYFPQRNTGTLMCHYRHHMHTDPFFYPGLQDITTHIDFTAFYREALAAGLDLLGFDTQANYLIQAGLPDLLTGPGSNGADWYPISQAIQLLTSPAEMGEIFKVIAFGKGVTPALPGFV